MFCGKMGDRTARHRTKILPNCAQQNVRKDAYQDIIWFAFIIKHYVIYALEAMISLPIKLLLHYLHDGIVPVLT